ncbi:bifunctional serine/threonine-protein kinase/ABC transporter substrate-binding protein [Streptomyces sp. NBC_01186]|uniref:serine/threonine-protein kinase n=1 Tax=Streptomyces sp. NBC_01186 TaxID=2903765 RepID=UPI002E0E90C7|nr:bifunctional serine/threonine-protein kinase/ABC transporter substrate-binding protein [Streptomyces sp. NBC_01186]
MHVSSGLGGAVRGRVLSGRYELVDKLGAGGMGEVWRARDGDLGREVALKLFSPPQDVQGEERTELLGRFRREARAAAALDSPHIATIHDHGAHDGTPYLVMELIEGRSLEQVLRDDGRVPVRQALDWAAQICRGLGTAHAAGVVHRDIKPANIIVRPDGTAVVLDFGIAKFQEAVEAESKLTRTGHMPLGSVLYMAPERFRMEPGDGREDLYALGCVLYELLIGRPPYVGPAAGVMYNHLNDVPLRPSRARAELSVHVDRLILDLMAKRADDRPADAQEARARLVALRADIQEPEEDEEAEEPEEAEAAEDSRGNEEAEGEAENAEGEAGPEAASEAASETAGKAAAEAEAEGTAAAEAPDEVRSGPARGNKPGADPAPRPTATPKLKSSTPELKSSPVSPRKPVRALVGISLGVVLLAGVGVAMGVDDDSKADKGEADPLAPTAAPRASFDTDPPAPDPEAESTPGSDGPGEHTVVYTSPSATGEDSAAPVRKAFDQARKSLGLKADVDVVAVDSDAMGLDDIEKRYPDVLAVIGETSGTSAGSGPDDYAGPDGDGETPPVTISTCGEPGEDEDLDTAGKYSFRLQPSPGRVAAQLVSYLRQTYGARNPLVGDYGLSEQFTEQLREETSRSGGKASVFLDDSGTDDNGPSLNSRVKKEHADAVLLPQFSYSGAFATADLLRSEFRGPVLVPLPAAANCDPDLADVQTEEPEGPEAKGLRRYRSSPLGSKAARALEHDAALAVAAALARQQKTSSGETRRTSLAENLKKVKAKGELGTVAFDARGFAKDRPLWIDRFDGKRWHEERRLAP